LLYISTAAALKPFDNAKVNKVFCKEFGVAKVFVGKFSNVLPCALVTESLYFSIDQFQYYFHVYA
jgi:hypothetical protein